MKRPPRPAPLGPDEHPELLWYYQHSAAAVGLHAQSYRDAGATQHEPQGPSAEQVRAARRQRAVRERLRRLSSRQRIVLEACYSAEQPPRNLVHVAGWPLARLAAAVVRAGHAVVNGTLAELAALVGDAHAAYCAEVERDVATLLAEQRQARCERDAVTAIGSTDARLTQHDRDVLQVAAWMREVLDG